VWGEKKKGEEEGVREGKLSPSPRNLIVLLEPCENGFGLGGRLPTRAGGGVLEEIATITSRSKRREGKELLMGIEGTLVFFLPKGEGKELEWGEGDAKQKPTKSGALPRVTKGAPDWSARHKGSPYLAGSLGGRGNSTC